MERGTKRKAATAAPGPIIDLRPTKRPKPTKHETVQSTTESGLEFLAHLRRTTDKNMRNISTAFERLPDRKMYPHYYDFTKMPLAIETIAKKLRDGKYSTLTALESDVKRLVQNAKDFNDKESEIYEDAERVRKTTYNWMKPRNPAYDDPSYQAFPTPLPKGPTIRLHNNAPREQTISPERVPKRSASAPKREDRKSVRADSSKPGDNTSGDPEGNSYKGLDMQSAQRKLIIGMKEYKHPEYEDLDGGRPTFLEFLNLPSRENTHYYSVIKDTACLSRVLKFVNGWESREKQTGPTPYKRWEQFEQAVAKIWDNAMTYNEDGSELHERAQLLRDHFKARLEEVKQDVPGPASQKIKLGFGSGKAEDKKTGGLKLNLTSSKKDTSVPPKSNDSATPTSLAANGQPGNKQNPASERIDARPPVNAQPPSASRPSSARPGTGDGASVKAELRNGMGPPLAPGAPNGLAPRPPSGSPYPAQPPAPAPYVPQLGFDSKWRPEGREPSLIYLNVMTHPDLQVARPLTLSISPHPKLTYQSVTANLPATHNVLRVRPDLAPSLRGSLGRPYKVFLTVNGMRIQQRHEPPMMNGVSGTKSTGPSFDVKLMPGMNRVEFECAAAGGNRGVNGGRAEVELERVCVYANLMKT